MGNKISIKDFDFKNERVLLRSDLNVPIIDGKITDDTRILKSLPTIQKLQSDGAKTIICSHLGKPKKPDPNFSLKIVANKLSEVLGQTIIFADDDDVVSHKTKKLADNLKNGEILLLQNTRFCSGEKKNDENFASKLASLADYFVSDAFGSVHRAHASTVGVAKLLKKRFCGFLLEKELQYLGNAIENPERPFVAVLGGAKISDKIEVIDNLIDIADTIIIGGGMAYTFFKSFGWEIGNSIYEQDKLFYAKELKKKAAYRGVKFFLPSDNVIADKFSNDANTKIVQSNQILPDWEALDIGPDTIRMFTRVLEDAKTIIWNGPMGAFEMENFANGTKAIAKYLATLTHATTIVGGGDSVAAVNQLNLGDKMSHLSTGGGASLEFLKGKELPGVAVLDDV